MYYGNVLGPGSKDSKQASNKHTHRISCTLRFKGPRSCAAGDPAFHKFCFPNSEGNQLLRVDSSKRTGASPEGSKPGGTGPKSPTTVLGPSRRPGSPRLGGTHVAAATTGKGSVRGCSRPRSGPSAVRHCCSVGHSCLPHGARLDQEPRRARAPGYAAWAATPRQPRWLCAPTERRPGGGGGAPAGPKHRTGGGWGPRGSRRPRRRR